MDEVREVTVTDLIGVTMSAEEFAIGLQLSRTPHPVLQELIETMESDGEGLRGVEVSGDALILRVDPDSDYARKVVASLVDQKLLERMTDRARALVAERTKAEERVRGVLVSRGLLSE